MKKVIQPFGLLKGWVCILDPTISMPYFYNKQEQRTTWTIPYDPNYHNNTTPASAQQVSNLVTLLNNRKQRIEQTQQNDTTATATTQKNQPKQPKQTEKTQIIETSISSKTRPAQIPKQIPKQIPTKHPLHVARTKLHSNTITNEEYSQIVQQHQKMEKETRTIVLQGELMKMGKRLGRFVKRWFVLHSDQQFCSCHSSNHRYKPTSMLDLSKYMCMPVDLFVEKGQQFCIELTEIQGTNNTILAAPSIDVQVQWLEAMLQTKTQTMGLGRLNVIKANAALKTIKRRHKMPSM